MAPSTNYYDILGVKKDATSDEIKKAFRRLARKHHPDTGGDEEKFKQVNEAYEALSDSEKRAQYDQYGQYFSGGAPGPGVPGGRNVHVNVGDLGDLGDIFGSVFGGGGFGGGRRTGPQPRRGRDVQVDLQLSFEQALGGTSAKVEVDATESCAACGGSGAKPGTGRTACATCSGSGQVTEGQGMFGFARACPRCGGEGTVIEQPCTACRGAGKVRRRKPISVQVPAGATDGGKLRFTGKGEPGENGGPAGDLYVITRIKPHRYFRRDGADVTLELPLSFAEAALGADVLVPTPDGKKAKLKVPAGTQEGKVFRLKGKGAPKLKGGGHGDLRIKAHVVVPAELSDEQREAIETLAAADTADLRGHLG
jgi:molecular chaperone DnaJ